MGVINNEIIISNTFAYQIMGGGAGFWPVTPKSVPPKSGPPGPIFAKKMVNFGSQNRSPRTDFGSQNWSPLAKNSPPLIMMHQLNLAPRTDFGSQNWSPLASPPLIVPDARTEFGKHDLLTNTYTFSYL